MIRKLTHGGNVVLAGFAAMILFMATLVYMCTRQRIDMSTDRYYEQELAFQSQINAAANTQQYAAQFSVRTEPGVVILQLPASLSGEIENANAVFYCKSDSRLDQQVSLQPNAGGEYRISTEKWSGKGKAFVAKIKFNSGGKSFYQELPVTIQ
ncbi:FixH family protein [Sediminibacterium ginsengisoli]|uniref:FixH protein n=1 Tax=Sediminibacterium ginsengisoli TaxID=413434 RepID=A0A1T4PBT6_9BACT|nr:FixH family protein [Sediminibacterium ginsengisoli]SJZ88696.1 FixH protein [Sediminibacterium ginsengisoli]